MSYMRRARPRWYNDTVNWLLASGQMPISDITNTGNGITTGTVEQVFDMKPSNRVVWNTNGESAVVTIQVDFGTALGVNHVCILNHNMDTAGASVQVKWTSGSTGSVTAATGVLNCDSVSGVGTPTADGDSIQTIENILTESDYTIEIAPTGATFTADVEIGAILFGYYVTMPHNPEQGVTINPQYPVKRTETAGGSRFSNVPWVGAPINGYAPFRGNANKRAPGRMVQDYRYNYINDTSLLPHGYDLTTQGVIMQAYNSTIGGHIPMIHVPDSSSDVEGDYLFCRLTNFTGLTEVSCNVYSFGYTIEEEF